VTLDGVLQKARARGCEPQSKGRRRVGHSGFFIISSLIMYNAQRWFLGRLQGTSGRVYFVRACLEGNNSIKEHSYNQNIERKQ